MSNDFGTKAEAESIKCSFIDGIITVVFIPL